MDSEGEKNMAETRLIDVKEQARVCRYCGKAFKRVCIHGEGTARPHFAFVAECECEKKLSEEAERRKRTEAFMAEARVPARLADLKFDTYPEDQMQVERIQEWMARPVPGILLMVGSVGRGKSGLACAALERMAERGRVRYFYAYDLLVERVSGDTMEVLRSALEPKTIVIDEIGLQLKTPSGNEFMERILVGRHDDYKNTILISNMGAKEFKPLIGPRAWDRAVNDGSLMIFEGQTFRCKA